MKLLLAIVVVALAYGAWYLYENPQHVQPLVEGTPLEQRVGATSLYRWRDSDGTMHITDEPPDGGIAYETVTYSHDTNVIPVPPELRKKD
ncbi:MAG: DUF4124 domain-containing protein [Gammaproteobacteria bacterium]|nr:DUF4124 domain-containing protein [Gammaproteobacteria bacterium]